MTVLSTTTSTTSPPLTFGGLASGLDTKSIIAALMNVESVPLQQKQDDRAALVDQQDGLRQLNTLLLALRDAARGIDNRSDTLTTASSSEELLATSASATGSTLDVTSSGDAQPGSYDVRVDQLASTARRVSAAYGAATALAGQAGDSFRIDYGGSSPISITLAGTESLQDLRDEINSDANNDGSVQASLLDDGKGGVRLVVAGRQTGSAHDVQITTSITAPGGASFVDGSIGRSAQDAQLVVFGVAISRGSNDVTDAIPGVTLHLKGTNDASNPADTSTVTVARDDDQIAARLQTLVDAWNAVRDFSIKQSTVDKTTNRAGVLSGDFTLRMSEDIAESALSSVRSFTGNSFSSLSSIGLQFDRDGRLQLDRTTLSSALDKDPAGVRQLLSGDGTNDGVATAVARSLDSLVRPGDGTVVSRISSIDDQLKQIDDDIAEMNAQLADKQDTLTQQFAALEQTISTLQSSSSYLDKIGKTSG